MQTNLLIGIAGGLVSALLFYSAGRGDGELRLLLFLLTPLPSLIAGLGWGVPAAIVAALAGAVIMGVAVSPLFGLGYALALGVPVAMITHLLYLARTGQESQAPDWYPSGRLVAALALYGAAVPVLVLPLIGGTYAVLEPTMDAFVRRFFETANKQFGTPLPAPDKLKSVAHQMIDFLPAGFASYWVLIFAANLYVAGRITYASRHLARDWPDLHRVVLPTGMLALLLIALAGVTFGSGAPRIVATSLLGGMVVAFTFAGLSVIHAISHGTRRLLLWPLYISMPAIGVYTVGALLLIGIGEPILRLRERFGLPVPPPPNIT